MTKAIRNELKKVGPLLLADVVEQVHLAQHGQDQPIFEHVQQPGRGCVVHEQREYDKHAGIPGVAVDWESLQSTQSW